MIWEIHEQERVIEGIDASGRPDPAYAAALGLLSAPFGRRALALACDLAIWVVIQLPLWIGALPLVVKLLTGAVSPYGFVNHPDFGLGVVTAGITVLLTLVFAVVQLVLHGRKGMTLGKAMAGVRSVNVRTLERPGVGAVLLRLLIVVAAGVVPFGSAVFLLSPTFDPQGRGRGWHDKATNVWLVDVRNGLDPYDEKRMRIARKTVNAEPVEERAELPSLATPLDPARQPEYRPGSRISAGVLGLARPPETSDRPTAPTPAPAPAQAPVPQPRLPQPQLPQLQPDGVPELMPAASRSATLVLRLDTGERIPVPGPILLGRNPDAAEHPGARPIRVADGSRTLSKTHMLVRPVTGGLEVVDCASTNGSGLIRAGVDEGLTAGVPVRAADGDRIRLGDRTADIVRA
ncbi:RDD family protein [Microbacterium immunditiarum]|uniref:Putative RDD family membrane protein YckC n=1 Tax=Microbacterium immunditiarum TaxID=337480 RepID=A0A7Y9GRB3_9MICO|nr:RDD family protein [Microbacterium immunditiarum]NYE21209.1 putative RDD family membrane protein YckC [Microbacterium immunditiarum]